MNLRELANFLNRIKKRIRENSENLHGLNETIQQMRNSLEEDPFLLVGLISDVGDDQSSSDSAQDQSSTYSDQSSTHCAKDRGDAKEKNPDTTGTSKNKEGLIKAIIALLNWWGGDGGGDGSPGIQNLWIYRVLYSYYSAGIKLYSFIETIPAGWRWVLYTLIGSITIYRIYGVISLASKTYQFDLRWMLPSFTRF